MKITDINLADFLFFFGLALLGYGASQFHSGLGLAIVGLLLVLYVKPLKAWWR